MIILLCRLDSYMESNHCACLPARLMNRWRSQKDLHLHFIRLLKRTPLRIGLQNHLSIAQASVSVRKTRLSFPQLLLAPAAGISPHYLHLAFNSWWCSNDELSRNIDYNRGITASTFYSGWIRIEKQSNGLGQQSCTATDRLRIECAPIKHQAQLISLLTCSSTLVLFLLLISSTLFYALAILG